MKKKNSALRKTTLLISLFSVFVFYSCTSHKQLQYFRDLPDSTVIHLPPTVREERIIENGDRINVIFNARDPEAAVFFNVSSGTKSIVAEKVEVGYLIDHNGFLEFPIIGKVKAGGLTVNQLKENLTQLVTPYLKQPLVEVQHVNFRVSVLGEVRSPGTYTLPMQRTTIFEVLAAAGDLLHSAKRYDVQLYRDYNGQRTITRFDLRSKDILSNPNIFQIRHNDVVYVQPRPGAIFKEDFGVVTSLFTMMVGVVTLSIAIFSK